MSAMGRFGLAALVVGLSIGVAPRPAAADDIPAIPATPAPVRDVISVQAFTMDKPATHVWRAERPQVRSGYLVVLRVDPALVVPRQSAMPILYVGRQTAERVNNGHVSGYVVAIVPAELKDRKHRDYIDWSRDLVFFGLPGLPEAVDAVTIEEQRIDAVADGIKPLPAARVRDAVAKGGRPLHVASKVELIKVAANLIEKHAPDEKELVAQLRMAK